MKVQSNFDPDTHYVVTSKHVRICREGDKMTMAYSSIPEQAKRFRAEIQEELLAIYAERHPLVACKYCGKQFYKEKCKKYCSPECRRAEDNKRARKQQSKREQTCLWCGEFFQGYNGTMFCSPECKKEGRANKKKEDTRPIWESHLQEKLELAETRGMSYAEMQRQETLKLVGRVVI